MGAIHFWLIYKLPILVSDVFFILFEWLGWTWWLVQNIMFLFTFNCFDRKYTKLLILVNYYLLNFLSAIYEFLDTLVQITFTFLESNILLLVNLIELFPFDIDFSWFGFSQGQIYMCADTIDLSNFKNHQFYPGYDFVCVSKN